MKVDCFAKKLVFTFMTFLLLFFLSSMDIYAQENQPLRVAVIVFDYPDAVYDTFMEDDVNRIFETDAKSVNNFYSSSTYGKIQFEPTYFGPYFVPIEKSFSEMCGSLTGSTNYTGISYTMAVDDGMEPDDYDLFAFFFPLPVGCSTGTQAGSYKNKPAIWVYTTQNVGAEGWVAVIVHELGHTLGLGHASLLQCDPFEKLFSENLFSSCTYSQYGDDFDVMGQIYLFRELSGVHRMYLGAFDNQDITTVTESGIYDIYPLHSSSSPKLIVVPAPESVHQDYYYIDYRLPQGVFDSNINPDIGNGVQIRVSSDSPLGIIDLTDFLPMHHSSLLVNFPSNIFNNLRDGEQLLDTFNNLSIKQISHNEEKATLEISYPSQYCMDSLISADMTPESASGYIGEGIEYTINVTNNNPDYCDPTNLTLTPITKYFKEGWTFEPETIEVSLAAQDSTSVSFLSTPTDLKSTWNDEYVVEVEIRSDQSEELIKMLDARHIVQDQIAKVGFDKNVSVVKIGEEYTLNLELIDISGNRYQLTDANNVRWLNSGVNIISQTPNSITVVPAYLGSVGVGTYIDISDRETLYAKGTIYSVIDYEVCQSDANDEGTVEIGDIAAVLYYWGQECLYQNDVCVADADDNKHIGIGDIAAIIYHWNKECIREVN